MAARKRLGAKGRNGKAHHAFAVLSREIVAKKGELRRQRRTASSVARHAIDLQVQLLDNIEADVRFLGHAKGPCILSLAPLDSGSR